MVEPTPSVEESAASFTGESPAVPVAEVERLVAGVEPAAFRPILAGFLAGAVSPAVAVMQMACVSDSGAAVRAAVDEVTARTDADSRATDSIVRDRVDDLTRILVDHEDGIDRLVDMLRSDREASVSGVAEGIAYYERLFEEMKEGRA